MNKTFIGILVAALILVIGGLYYFFREVSVPSPSSTVTEKVEEGKIQLLGTQLSEAKDGKIQWEINADQITTKTDRKIIDFANIRAHIFGASEQGNVTFTATEGQLDTVNKIMTLQGNIKAVSDQGAEFLGNMAKWFTTEHRFTAEGDVQYHRPDVTIMGDKLEIEQNFTKVRVSGNARAELRRDVHE